MLVEKVIFTRNGMERFETAIELALTTAGNPGYWEDRIYKTSYIKTARFTGTLYEFTQNEEVSTFFIDGEKFTSFTIQIDDECKVHKIYIDIDRSDILAEISVYEDENEN